VTSSTGTQLHDLTALEQAAAVRAREVSPTELVEHSLARIEALDAGIGAFITVTAERARAAAARADRAVVDGAHLPPLHGVPTAIKDLNNTAGVRTTFGSAVLADFVPDVDDAVVTALEAAGTISLGKTNTPEFGFPCYTDNDVAGPARCPWDLSLLAGGSSGGAAAAVAAGLLPFAQGSDGGGSIRIPAGINGLFGIKPSRGRVSNAPYSSEVTGLGVQGPLARTVRDAAAMLDAMAGPVTGDPFWAPPPPAGESFLGYADRPPGRLRIGRYLDSGMPGADLDPEVRAAFEDASALLASLGHEVEDLPAPPLTEGVFPAFEVVWALSGTTLPVPEAAVPRLRPLTRFLRERGLALSAQDAMEAMFTRSARCPPGRWAGSTGTATARRTSNGRSATPPSRPSTTSPGSRRSACRCGGRRPVCPSAPCWWADPPTRPRSSRWARSSRTPGPGRTVTPRCGDVTMP
jgi:amidase